MEQRLGEARQRLAKLAKNDQSTKAAAARALGRVVLASPDEGVTGVAPRPVQTQQHKQALVCSGKDCVSALAKVLKGSDDSSCRKAAAASLQDVAARAAEASDRAVANLALIVADAAETSKTAPAPAPAPPKKQGEKEPVPDDPVKRARSTVDAALHLLDASVAVRKPDYHKDNVASMAWGA